MKIFKWKVFVITSIICLLPILLGIFLWDKLPDTMAIHFNFYGEADGFASREFVVFGLPVLMVPFQAIVCVAADFNSHKYGERKKFETVTKWILPVLTVILYVVTLGYSLGWNMDIRKIVVLILGCMFIVLGNYMPKLDYIKNYNLDKEKARKINRFIGYETVIMGLLFIITVFLPSVFSMWNVVLLIPYALIGVIYGIKTAKNR